MLVDTSWNIGLIDNLKIPGDCSSWTSGQWMTEKRGGSDVGGACDTYAVHEEGDTVSRLRYSFFIKTSQYRLNGYKWFSSAIDADVAVTVARIVDKEGKAVEVR